MCLSFEVLAALGREVQNHMSESRGFNSSEPRCREAREDSKASAEAATFASARTEAVHRDLWLCVGGWCWCADVEHDICLSMSR